MDKKSDQSTSSPEPSSYSSSLQQLEQPPSGSAVERPPTPPRRADITTSTMPQEPISNRLPDPFINAFLSINPLEKARRAIQEMQDRDRQLNHYSDFIEENEYQQIHSHYRGFYPALIDGAIQNYIPPSGETIKSDAEWCTSELARLDKENNTRKDQRKFVEKQVALFEGNFKVDNALISDNNTYSITNCPVRYLMSIFNLRNYLSMLQGLTEEQRTQLAKTLEQQLQVHEVTIKTCATDIAWIRSGQAKFEESESVLHDLEHKKKRLETLVPYLKKQIELLKGAFRVNEKETVNIFTCPPSEIARLFPDRYIMRQVTFLDYHQTQLYLSFLKTVFNHLSKVEKENETRISFLKLIQQKITDFRRLDELKFKIQPAINERRAEPPPPSASLPILNEEFAGNHTSNAVAPNDSQLKV